MSATLDGLTVIDLSRALAGPQAAMMLGDLGARVIKVEQPATGDDSRGWGPPFVGEAGAAESTYFLSCNRNKESITLDLKDPPDAEILRRLIVRADVLVENFRSGVLDRLGFPVEELHRINPGLVILSITGFGPDGPEAGRAGYDQIAQGEAGLMALTGPSPESPTRVGVPIADLLAGIFGVVGVLAGLVERGRSGKGRVVRTSLLSAIVGIHAFQGTRWTVAGDLPQASGNHHPSICPYGLFRCADGAVQIAIGSEGLWERFAGEFGLDRPEFAGNAARVAARPDVIAAVENALQQWKRDDLLARLEQLGIPAGAVRQLDEVYSWDQVRSQGLIVEVEHSTLGTIRLPGSPIRFDGDPPPDFRPPPTLGEHSESIRAWLAG